jgi:hypothetical protein
LQFFFNCFTIENYMLQWIQTIERWRVCLTHTVPNIQIATFMCMLSLCQIWHMPNLCSVPNNSLLPQEMSLKEGIQLHLLIYQTWSYS